MHTLWFSILLLNRHAMGVIILILLQWLITMLAVNFAFYNRPKLLDVGATLWSHVLHIVKRLVMLLRKLLTKGLKILTLIFQGNCRKLLFLPLIIITVHYPDVTLHLK